MIFPTVLPNLQVSLHKDTRVDAACTEFAAYFAFYDFDSIRMQGYVHNFGGLDLAGYRIATHVWISSEATCNILVVPGLFDHAGLFLDVIHALLKEQYNVVVIDLPGHGLSSGPAAAINNFDEYGQLISECLAALSTDLPKPWHALGQSTGCAGIMNYLLRSPPAGSTAIQLSSIPSNRRVTLEKVVLLAPLLRPVHYGIVRLAYRLLSSFVKHIKRNFTRNSHDSAFLSFIEQKDPLQPRFISVAWVGAMVRWAEEFVDKPTTDTSTHVPMLIVQGTDDQTVDFEYNIPHIKSKFPVCDVAYVGGAMHHLARESDIYRGQVLKSVSEFLHAGD